MDFKDVMTGRAIRFLRGDVTLLFYDVAEIKYMNFILVNVFIYLFIMSCVAQLKNRKLSKIYESIGLYILFISLEGFNKWSYEQ